VRVRHVRAERGLRAEEFIVKNGSRPHGKPATALLVLTSLFFMWGLITSLNDILIPHHKAAFDLSFVQAMLIQFCFFGAYFMMSFPSGYLVERAGTSGGSFWVSQSPASAACFFIRPPTLTAMNSSSPRCSCSPPASPCEAQGPRLARAVRGKSRRAAILAGKRAGNTGGQLSETDTLDSNPSRISLEDCRLARCLRSLL
jgi:hypothetical protein